MHVVTRYVAPYKPGPALPALSKDFPMKIRMNRLFLLAALAVCGLVLSACQSNQHTMVEPKPGQVVVCSKCYDDIRKARSSGGPRGGLANRMITTHRCEDCKTDMSIYEQDGVLMVRCATCAPAGLPCDKCLPPKAATR